MNWQSSIALTLRILATCVLATGEVFACPDDNAISERPADFLALHQIAADISQDLRYRKSDNFLGIPVDGYAGAECWLTQAAAKALQSAQAALRTQGWSLKVYDCYRPQRAVNHFMRWARNPDESTRARYYPQLPKRELLEQVYIARCSGHSRGSTVDVGLVAQSPPLTDSMHITCGAQDPQLADMGTGFDCFDERANTDHPATAPRARRHRDILRTAMTQAGFRNYDKEWWHYTLVNEPYSDRYFDFLPVSSNSGAGISSSGLPSLGVTRGTGKVPARPNTIGSGVPR